MNYNKFVKFVIIAVVLTLTFAILLNNLNTFNNISNKEHRVIPTLLEEE